jgi:hypothetical protein
MLMHYSYVPGTEDKVFEPADEDSIRELPFGPDLQRLFTAVNKLLGMDTEGLEKMTVDATKSPGNGRPANSDDESLSGAA